MTTPHPPVRKTYIDIFRKRNAFSPSNAILPEDYNLKRGMVFKNLMRQRVIVSTKENTFYMDDTKYKNIQDRYRKISTLATFLLLMLLLAGFILMIRK